jgi:hypothetical protein
MVIVIGNGYVSTGDMVIIRKFCRFVLDKFVKRSVQNKMIMTVKFMHPDDFMDEESRSDLSKYRAWCSFDSVEDGKKRFTVIIKARKLDPKVKTVRRLKEVLKDLGHEITHVKQYLNGEMKDYVDGSYTFLGKKYTPNVEGGGDMASMEFYYDSPSEIEAYGREIGLYRMFVKQLNNPKPTKVKDQNLL